MKKNSTEIVFILDRSGSMRGLEADTIGGFNAMLDENRKKNGKAIVSLIFFNEKRSKIRWRDSISEIQPLSNEDYFAAGNTALLDALGMTVEEIEKAQKSQKPANTLFIIMTDGYENASFRFTYNDIHRIIKEKQDKRKWEFMFVGANIDAGETAVNLGISKEMAVDYLADEEGTKESFACFGRAIDSLCETGTIPTGWQDAIATDYEKRKK